MDFLSELNDKQYEAVSSNSQYLRIIAGAGSGKTRVLTYRIAYLIENKHVFPSQILAFTFTNKVCKEMNTRASKLVSNELKFPLNIYTFHGFCARFLRAEISVLDMTSNFMIIDDEDQEKIIKNIISERGYRRNDEIGDKLIKFISYYKMLGKLPSEVEINKNDKKKAELLDMFFEYEREKNSMFSLDFDDLLIYTIKILKQFDFIRYKYQNRYKHILIDEFQDTNDVQYELVRLLCNDETNLFVVGDPDQTIYTWRGANQNIILDIDKHFNPMTTVVLNQNYRSTQPILNHANELINFNKARIKKDLFTKNNGGLDVEVNSFDTKGHEAQFVANKIKEMMMNNKTAKYEDFCILYRSSYLSLAIEKAFIRNKIPYVVYGGIKFFSRKEIKDCLAYFRLIVNTKDDVSFERIINVPSRKIGANSLLILKTEAHELGLSMIEYLEKIGNYKTNLRASVIFELSTLLSKMEEVRNEMNNNYEHFDQSLRKFLEEIGYFSYLTEDEEDGDDRLENVNALIEDVKDYLKKEPNGLFIDYLNNVSLSSGQDDIKNKDVVSLMTVHTAKGLEFDTVFVISLVQDIFPNHKALLEKGEDGLEEERRLCYVAFTRAKENLYVSYNTEYNYASQSNGIASQFIGEAKLKSSQKKLSSFSSNKILYSTNIFSKQYGKEENKRNIIYQNIPQNHINLNQQKNNVKWEVNDNCYHESFGEGKVIKVDGDIIEVFFKEHGNKKLLGSHYKLSKR